MQIPNQIISKATSFLKKHIGIVLLCLSLLIGFCIYDDYGISWDDPMQRSTGEINYNYVFKGDNALKTFNERDYGVAFELPLIIIEKVFNIKDTRNVYLMRHLATYLFFVFSAFICFLLIEILYKNKLLAACGFLLLLLNPLIYTHAFFNTKDIPFLSMFIVCFFLTALAFKINRYHLFIMLGMACGLLTNLRIMGILLVICIGLCLLIDMIIVINHKKLRTKSLIHVLAFSLAFLITLYATGPFLWASPLHNFITTFRNMSVFRQEVPVLYFGQLIKAPDLSRMYCLVWFLISTPILYLLFGFFGIGLVIYKFFRNPLLFITNSLERNNLIYLACFFGPIMAVIIFKSVLYDGWRQLYFIYPSFVLLILFGLNQLFKTKAKKSAIILLFIGFSSIGIFMIKNHPFQYVYFNQFVSSKKENHFRKNFDMDYWGISYKKSLDYILENDTSKAIKISVANYSGCVNGQILKPEQRKRITFVDEKDAKYFITNYRWHPKEYTYPSAQIFHSFTVSNNSINTIYKLK